MFATSAYISLYNRFLTFKAILDSFNQLQASVMVINFIRTEISNLNFESNIANIFRRDIISGRATWRIRESLAISIKLGSRYGAIMRELTHSIFIATSLKPFSSNRWIILPTKPRCTPSGLTMMKVRSLFSAIINLQIISSRVETENKTMRCQETGRKWGRENASCGQCGRLLACGNFFTKVGEWGMYDVGSSQPAGWSVDDGWRPRWFTGDLPVVVRISRFAKPHFSI